MESYPGQSAQKATDLFHLSVCRGLSDTDPGEFQRRRNRFNADSLRLNVGHNVVAEADQHSGLRFVAGMKCT